MVKIASPVMRNDVLLDIATFLARRWSGNDKVVIILMPDKPPTAKLDKNQIILSLLNYYPGTDFQKYRQWRVALWFESMRMKHSSKVLSNEHAFGFLLNTLETKRIEILGLREWEGMANELNVQRGHFVDVASAFEFDIWPLQNSGGIFAIFSHWLPER